ncbi:sugar-transfer associated ATP-grasp domain-containing protein [Fibrobacter sp.]|uniref:sugar-transfer associated ATP-grasp domain-containing protein n=1 Tax=Fibrobacter sp. TaxID=35828 RepID=UPI0025C1DA61|nr:sugar-transfer associated ATP-grasp domain-containing protein [Fibrobacter sp.]MBR4006596.1 hypothetical protein [Fibrobacter sp.]
MLFVSNAIHKYRLKKARNWAISMEKANLESLQKEMLTKLEKRSLKEVWGSLGLSINPLFYEMFKTLEGFNPYYLSDDLFFPFIIRTLNPSHYVDVQEHKGLYPVLYKDLPQPEILGLKFNGVLFNKFFEIVDDSYIFDKIEHEKSYIIKPSTGSCMGRNVRKFDLRSMTLPQIKELISSYGENFIIQGVVKQSSKTRAFNESSLNTFRVSTLNLNNHVSVCTINFKCGRNGAHVDNGGAGGLFFGVSKDGQFREYAYDNKYKKYYKLDSGLVVKDVKIDAVKELVNFAIDAHKKYIPLCGFAGWDLALDENDKPVFIEVNLGFPGIQLEQLAAAQPIFGDRTCEVIDYVVKNQKMI